MRITVDKNEQGIGIAVSDDLTPEMAVVLLEVAKGIAVQKAMQGKPSAIVQAVAVPKGLVP